MSAYSKGSVSYFKWCFIGGLIFAHIYLLTVYFRVPTSSGNHGKPGKSLKKSSMHGKIMELEKTSIIMEKSWNFVKDLRVRQLVFWLLLVSSSNYFKMHAWSTSMLLLLHSAFMLSVVKLLLNGQVGVCALDSHGNYTVDHGKS